MSTVTVDIFEPIGVGDRLLYALWGTQDVLGQQSGQVTGCTWSTTLPGGYGNCNVTLAPDALRRRDLARHPYAHAVVYLDGACVFEGRLMPWGWQGKHVTKLTIRGYYFAGLDEHPFTSGDLATYTTGTVLEMVLASGLCRPGPSTYWHDPQVPWVPHDLDAKMPSECVDLLMKAGNAGGTLTDVLVFNDRIVRLMPRRPPFTADYLLDGDDDRLSGTTDWSGAFGAVSLDYTVITDDGFGHEVRTPTVTPRHTNASYTTRSGGVFRNFRMHGGTYTNDAASDFVNAQLATLAYPHESMTLALEAGEGLTTPGGLVVPFHQVWAGQWVEVLDEPAYLPIVDTRADAFAGTLQATLGAAQDDFANLLGNVRERAGYADRNLNPMTGDSA